MTQPPKGGPAFANTPDVASRQQPPAAPAAAPAKSAVNGTSSAPASQAGPDQSGPGQSGATQPGPGQSAPTQPGAGTTSAWSAPTEAPGTNGAYPLNGSRNGSAPAAPMTAAPVGGSSAGFGTPTINNGSVTRTAAPGALAALDAQAAAAAAATARPEAPLPPAPTGRNANPAGRRPPRGPRRARLQLRHLNPWSVLKFSCVLSVFLFFMWMLTIAGLYEALNGAGVISKINDTVTTINGAGSATPVTVRRVLGGAVLIGVINMVMFIALSTVGSVVYNFIADLIGGVELTLSEGV
jgi:hypothetical protein